MELISALTKRFGEQVLIWADTVRNRVQFKDAPSMGVTWHAQMVTGKAARWSWERAAALSEGRVCNQCKLCETCRYQDQPPRSVVNIAQPERIGAESRTSGEPQKPAPAVVEGKGFG